ncbi:MAG: toprim domain-containing protein [Proteobacteria bacterium]|nr:toprim domain-containing protein [Pseudomonadota bacterium]
MTFGAADLARRLSAHAEAVCEHYLFNGRKAGRYWLVGDVHNAEGQSLHVRLAGPSYGPGAAGKWSDEATGEHGDLLDLIRINRGLRHFHSLREEVLSFLSEPVHIEKPVREKALVNSRPAAKRLFAGAKPVAGTLAEVYLRGRGLAFPSYPSALRYHPGCYYRPDSKRVLQQWPALLAALTDHRGDVTGLLRTYLARDGSDKAPLGSPRLGMGDFLGHAVRFDNGGDALVLGEGLETVLSIKLALPGLPAAAALTANHMRAFLLPDGLKRLYIAADNDLPGLCARDDIQARAEDDGIAVATLLPEANDWNASLCAVGLQRLRDILLPLLHADDRALALT